MRVSDFMSRDRGDGNRAYRRNVARVHYRGANGATVTINQRETPHASAPRAAVRAVIATAGAMLAGAVGRTLAKAQAPVVAPVVANLDAERAARQRAAKDRKNAAARAKRLASRQAA